MLHGAVPITLSMYLKCAIVIGGFPLLKPSDVFGRFLYYQYKQAGKKVVGDLRYHDAHVKSM